MTTVAPDRRGAWINIGLFILILLVLSSIAHFAIVKLNPASLYVGALMWCPAVAAFLTLTTRGRGLAAIPWRWGGWRYGWMGYLTPALYIVIAYALIWGLGLGGAPNRETIAEWSAELGLGPGRDWVPLAVMVALLATVQVIKSLGSVAGEEIGWRGFFIWELRKVLPFGGVALVSGLVWSVWHFPIIVTYGGGNIPFQLGCFTIMIVSMSFTMTYFTFRSNSIWPAVLFHAAHNVFIQKIFTPLTVNADGTRMWTDEYGLMVPLVAAVIAVFYWRKARSEGL